MTTKDYRKVVRHLEGLGWTLVSQSRTGHPKLRGPGGSPTIAISSTPSDHRALQNFIRDVRHAGVTWPPPKPRKESP